MREKDVVVLTQVFYTAACLGNKLLVGVGYVVIDGVVDVSDRKAFLLQLFSEEGVLVSVTNKMLVEAGGHKRLARDKKIECAKLAVGLFHAFFDRLRLYSATIFVSQSALRRRGSCAE